MYSCFGLGSCIGLFVQDRLRGLSGGAHILLPESEKVPDGFKFYNVIAALDEILNHFKSQGSNLSALRALKLQEVQMACILTLTQVFAIPNRLFINSSPKDLYSSHGLGWRSKQNREV